MVDAALLWIGANAALSVVSVGAFIFHYVWTHEPDYFAVAFAAVWAAGVVELGMASGYVPEPTLFHVPVVVCLGVALVAGGLSVRQSEIGFRLGNRDTR
ncbi:hypothetical protein [Halomarina ordinaria]|uniref:Uncharacterized protein n=1 Tax=Halomarina ordinaria TaxID=3033939 RepID=A0ABD5U8H1_9EURY|nr:hypothetical protein [Halomarina sp. PSRA2]